MKYLKMIFTFKILIKFMLLSMVVLTTGSCDRYKTVREKLNVAENLMNAHPDSALAILDNIPSAGINNREVAARYALLKSIALDKNYIDTTNFDVLQPAIDYYIKNGKPDEKLRTYYYQGRIYQNKGDDDAAMQSFMCGREYCQESSDTLTMANLMVAQATIQYSIYKIDDFIKNNLEAANLYRAINRPDYEIYSLANVLDGSFINNDKHLADSVMSVAQERVKHNSELSKIIVPYTLSYALKFGDKEEVINILDYYKSLESIDDIDKLDIAEAYYKIGDASNAKRILYSIPLESKAHSSLKYLAIKPSILELNGDLTGALHAYQDFSTVIDSIHMSIFSHDLLFAQKRHEMEKSNILEKQKFDKIIWLSLCIVFVLLIITVYIYYRYRLGQAQSLLDAQERQRLQLEQENLRTEKEKAELERDKKTLEAANLRLEIDQLEDERDNLKELQKEQSELSKPIKDVIKNRLDLLNGLLAKEITNNDRYAEPYNKWIDTVRNDKKKFMDSTRLAFAASHQKFMEYLEQHGLSTDEINYLCLYAIGLRGKEVGEYTQMKRHYIVSHEIRKKLGIDEHETNIGPYIRRLMKGLE